MPDLVTGEETDDEYMIGKDNKEYVTWLKNLKKGYIHRDGDHHRAVRVWIFSDGTQELLLQQRAECKDSWPASCPVVDLMFPIFFANLVHELASRYGLLLAHGLDEIEQNMEAVQNSITDLNRFGKVFKLAAFSPFDSVLDALNQCNAVSKDRVLACDLHSGQYMGYFDIPVNHVHCQ
ncbi:nucleolar 56-like, partial [Olea europaea subsp. europaea]